MDYLLPRYLPGSRTGTISTHAWSLCRAASRRVDFGQYSDKLPVSSGRVWCGFVERTWTWAKKILVQPPICPVPLTQGASLLSTVHAGLSTGSDPSDQGDSARGRLTEPTGFGTNCPHPMNITGALATQGAKCVHHRSTCCVDNFQAASEDLPLAAASRCQRLRVAACVDHHNAAAVLARRKALSLAPVPSACRSRALAPKCNAPCRAAPSTG